jgi:Uma2 family endonuclease
LPPRPIGERVAKGRVRGMTAQSWESEGLDSMSQNLIKKPVWTYEDYCVLPQDLNRHEIIEGDHIVTPSPGTRHQIILGSLLYFLESHVRTYELGTVLAAPMDVLLAPTSVVQPDLLFIRKERDSIITEPNIEGPPDLVVEILSPSTAAIDRDGKMALYAKYAVPHYWIVDSIRLTLETYELEATHYSLVAQFGKDEIARSSLFPGLEIPMAELQK